MMDKTKKVMVLGAGMIGSLIAFLLTEHSDYEVILVDRDTERLSKVPQKDQIAPMSFNAESEKALFQAIKSAKPDALVSALPYYLNPIIAKAARDNGTHYFDLTEDVEVTQQISRLSRNTKKAFAPQGGLAPGFISIVTQCLIERFDKIDTVKMRVGALPLNPNNALKYSLTWSTDGLINEYGNPCEAILNGNKIKLQPLDGLETIEVDGLLYEAFNTSGGLGTLAESCQGKVLNMDYKTMRYPGHCDKIQFLMRDLKLNHDRDTLKRILENTIPKTRQDVVLIYSSVTGLIKGELFEENYFKKIYPREIGGINWSAIQITTAASQCCILDLVFKDPGAHLGFVTQESFKLKDFLSNRFGIYFH
ncbi:MAG: saccharopine dehydrogenase NADP-binding domain-containing protein [Deltaproteobacteria bacterium]|nr:saccharopine dehydrogenase NADP-binding domain-containing protein [Deltaproteobacteria bacterium]